MPDGEQKSAWAGVSLAGDSGHPGLQTKMFHGPGPSTRSNVEGPRFRNSPRGSVPTVFKTCHRRQTEWQALPFPGSTIPHCLWGGYETFLSRQEGPWIGMERGRGQGAGVEDKGPENNSLAWTPLPSTAYTYPSLPAALTHASSSCLLT